MGQLYDYIASVFTSGSQPAEKGWSRRVTFGDHSFTEPASYGGQQDQANRSNKRTIFVYQFVIIISFLVLFSNLWPRLCDDSFDFSQPQGWQLVTLNLLPFIVGLTAIFAMNEFNKPLPEGTKIGNKNSRLSLDKNDFGFSLKVLVGLMAFCQLASIYYESVLWLAVVSLPIWCFRLASKVAQFEHERCAQSDKKPWVSIKVTKSPKAVTPKKSASQHSAKTDDHNKATPRTKTKKAVKNFLNNVSDKYHAFEQNVAQQISTRMNPPIGQAKMIDTR